MKIHIPRAARAVLVGACLLVIGLITCPNLSAAPIFEYDFQDGQTTGWSASDSSMLSVTNDPLDASNKVLMADATTGTLGATWTTFSALTSGTYRLTLQLMVADSGGIGSSYELDRRISLTSSNSSVSSYTRYRNPSGTNVLTSGYNGNGTNGGTFSNGPTVALNKWYEIVQIVDLDNKTWNWEISDVATGTNLYTSGSLGFMSNVSNLKTLTFASINPQTNGLFYLDNVAMEQIPEPTSVATIIFGGLICYSLRRYRKRDREK